MCDVAVVIALTALAEADTKTGAAKAVVASTPKQASVTSCGSRGALAASVELAWLATIKTLHRSDTQTYLHGSDGGQDKDKD